MLEVSMAGSGEHSEKIKAMAHSDHMLIIYKVSGTTFYEFSSSQQWVYSTHKLLSFTIWVK